MGAIEELKLHLKMSPREYLLSPLPSPVDEKIRELVRRYTPATGAELRSALSRQHSWYLLAFVARMAALAVREHNGNYLVDALAALSLEGGRLDIRENIQMLALIYNSAMKIGTDVTQLFSSALPAGNAELDDAIRSFPLRADKDKTIESMGFREAHDESGFRYVRTW
jgi:hypothetical protein